MTEPFVCFFDPDDLIGGEYSPNRLFAALSLCWDEDTCTSRMRKDWNPRNKTLGQCSITAFLVQDILGGDVYGIPLGDGNFHCYNKVGDAVFDLTSAQFLPRILDYSSGVKQSKEDHFRKEEKKERYLLLKRRFEDKTSNH